MGKASKLFNTIVDQDIFGQPIGVHYRGRDAFKTFLGSLCTLASYVLITVYFVTLIKGFLDGS